MGSFFSTEQNTESEPLRNSPNEQNTNLSNTLETQEENSGSQNLTNNLETEQPTSWEIEELTNALALEAVMRRRRTRALNEYMRTRALIEQLMRDSQQQRNNVTPEQRVSDAGQQSNNAATGEEKRYDPEDTTLVFVDGEDDMDFLDDDFKSLRAKMSCGHTVTPMSLTNWCKWLLDQDKGRFVCGHCKAEWPYEEVRKMALLTPEEKAYFEKKMFQFSKNNLDVKSCPGCESYVMRADPNNLQVDCISCMIEKHKAFTFCWRCLNEWKDPAASSDHCGNKGCQNPLEILRTCPDITFDDVRGVTGCPSTRACPTCGLLVEHDGTMCKNIECPQCKVEFCFVCLKLTEECERMDNYSCLKPCTDVAPRQTSIPVWNRK
ncbi:uncharacterized protein LOC131990131 [Centropristis striata]|uniref:uncharacterized protein LOC131990131 n=1 Tax=Centropristis striata TaxID=184440 RepID=UPI0027DEEF72|nr:uncharacterized protein LOC131990131 [Centropristis striata]